MSASLTLPAWEFEQDEPLFKMARVGAQAGSEEIGGLANGPAHVRRTRATPAGLGVSFPVGVAGAHSIEQEGPGTARLLVMSTMRFPDVVEHPENDRVLVMHGPPAEGTEFLLFKRSDD